jgi:hypothetical protein
MCLDQPNIELNQLYRSIQLSINIPFHIFCICSGIFFDIEMLRFVRKINKTQPIELIPWKSVNVIDKSEDIKVPLNATITSSTLHFASLILWYWVLSIKNIWYILCLISAFYIFTLPILLVFTIKQKSDKKPTQQPPRTLQFHNEDLDEMEENIDSNEMPNQHFKSEGVSNSKIPDKKGVFTDHKENPATRKSCQRNIIVHAEENVVQDIENQSKPTVNHEKVFKKIDKVTRNKIQELNASMLLPSSVNEIAICPDENYLKNITVINN